MFDIGGPELILIVLGIIVLFGPKKIPEIAQMIGKGLQKIKLAQAQFKDQINEIQSEVEKHADPIKNEIKEVNVVDLTKKHFDINNKNLNQDKIDIGK